MELGSGVGVKLQPAADDANLNEESEEKNNVCLLAIRPMTNLMLNFIWSPVTASFQSQRVICQTMQGNEANENTKMHRH